MIATEPIEIWNKKERADWRLPRLKKVSSWANERRVLDPDTSAEAGQYRSDRTPYMVGPMDAFTDDDVEQIIVMSASQVGKSTGIQNMIGYSIDEDPAPALYVVPRDEDVDYASPKIFKPMVQLSPALMRHTTGHPRDLQTNYFTFDRMSLYFGSAGSPAELAQKAIKNLFLDEPDKYPPFAGREANPIDLAFKRTRTFWDRKIVIMCTPTTKSGYIYNTYEKSNKQQYYIPCPRCGEYQVWIFDQLKYPFKDREPDDIRENSEGIYYECIHCAAHIPETQKDELVRRGRWVPEGQTIDVDGDLIGKPRRTKHISGFHITALISPWVTWSEIFIDWFEANTEEGILLGKLMDFQNATLGRPHEEQGKKVKASTASKLVSDYSRGTVPPDSLILVASADYHKTKRQIVRIDYEVTAFAAGLKNYVVNYGSTSSFDDMEDIIFRTPYPWSDAIPNEQKPFLTTSVLFIDSSFEPDDVYDYCLKWPGLVVPTRGMDGPRTKPIQYSDLESATERRLTRRQRRAYKGMQLMIIDNFYFKRQVMTWLEGKYDKDGKKTADALASFFSEIPAYYFGELTNEQLVKVLDTRGNIKWVWKKIRPSAQTHALDLRVLCAAAGYYKGVHYIRRPDDRRPMPSRTRQKKKAKTRRQRPKWLDGLPKIGVG